MIERCSSDSGLANDRAFLRFNGTVDRLRGHGCSDCILGWVERILRAVKMVAEVGSGSGTIHSSPDSTAPDSLGSNSARETSATVEAVFPLVVDSAVLRNNQP